jgi:transposase-like protein
VNNYSPSLEANFKTRKPNVADSWRIDDSYLKIKIKIKRKWVYYYRAADIYGAIVDFYLSETLNELAARAFFDKALNSNGLPSRVVTDKSRANIVSLDPLNVQLWLSGYMLCMVEVLTVKYLNNIAE